MAELFKIMNDIADIVSSVAKSQAIFSYGAGGLALGSIAGVIPRVGLVRALSLGFKSYFETTHPLSVRKSEIKQLSNSILWMKKGNYITVTGGKGMGKTCLIDTALNRHLGVVKISIESGASKSVIVDQALRALTGIQFDYFKPVGSARRLLFFYSFIFLKRPSPIVVIRVPERLSGQNYADVPAAVRDLADIYGLKVVVDGSPNSLPPELLTTNREVVIDVEPMSKEQIESIPEFKVLIDFLKSHNLDEPVWKVMGGSPIHYSNLETLVVAMLSLSDTDSDEVVNQVKNHLQSVLSDSLNKNVANSSSNTQAIINVFREEKINKISLSKLEAKGLLLDFPNKVFREVKTEGLYIVPSSAAVSLIISENIQNDEGVRELRDKLFKAT